MARLSERTARASGFIASPDLPLDERETLDLLQAALSPGYILIRRIGSGGMGSVYLARDPVLKRHVAVKLLSRELARDGSARARFQREAQAVASISHPNVVGIYSVGELPTGVPYFVMQYVAGPNLGERLESDGAFDVDSAARLLGEVASALAAAHRKGIIHRDVKPANILLDDDSGRALVSDFGIAAVLEEDHSDALRITQTGMAVGSPAYMSPEQLLAEPVSDKTDIYGLGLVGYELLTGAGPYMIASPREIMAAHLRDAPKSLSAERDDVTPELEALLVECLAKDPAARPSADEVCRRLSKGAGALLEWPPPGLEPLQGRARRPLAFLTVGGLALVTPLLVVSAVARESPVRDLMPPAIVVASVAAVGALLYLAGARSLTRLARSAAAAARAGYGWATLGEVLADDRQDAGSLITGAREFATLSPPVRGQLRAARLAALVLRLVAVLLLGVGYFAFIGIATRLGSVALLVTGALVLPLMLLAIAWGLALRESAILREPRRRIAAPSARGAAAELVAPWQAAFEAVRQGQSLGTGWSGARRFLAGALATGIAFVACAAITGYLLTLVGLGTEVFASTAAPRFSRSIERYQRLARLRVERAALDSTITPLRAGEALHTIASYGRSPSQQREGWLRPPARPIAGEWHAPQGEPPFPKTRGLWPYDAIRRAHQLTPADRAFLEARAASPLMPEFELLGRARAVDFGSAAWKDPLPVPTRLRDVPVPRFMRLRETAFAMIAQATLDLADGRPARAEARIREVIGVGFAVADGRDLAESWMGLGIVALGRDALEGYYEVTGARDAASRVSASADPAFEDLGPDNRSPVPVAEQVRMMRALVMDSTQVRGLRWEIALRMLPFEPCTNLQELVFGPGAEYGETFARSRRMLVQTRSDSILFALAENLFDERDGPAVHDVASNGGSRIASALDGLVGGHRFQTCVLLVSGKL